MAFQPLSIGDILMLSQTAWKIGRAFTQGQKSAPAEFAEVEREANGLSEALKLVAETLHSDGSILSYADNDVKSAVSGILESAHRTLADLESFVDRYQVIKRQDTNGGFLVERKWSEVVVANYKTFKWTTEGGDINDLRNMLQVHTNSINLTMQALQSRSLARLEMTVVPMAEMISSVHDRVSGDLAEKIDDLHRIIMSVANGSPSLVTQERGNARASTSTASILDKYETRTLELPSPRNSSLASPRLFSRSSSRSPPGATVHGPHARSSIQDDAVYDADSSLQMNAANRTDWDFETGSPGEIRRGSIGDSADADATNMSPKDSAYAPLEPRSRRSSHRRESATIPHAMHSPHEQRDVFAGSSRDANHSAEISPRTPQKSFRSPDMAALLPPPAMPPDVNQAAQPPATPSTFFANLSRARTETLSERPVSRPQTAGTQSVHRQSQPQLSNYMPGSKFERQLFRNAAILCDVRGRLVEFAQEKAGESDPRYNVEMLPACQEARICVIRKRENRDMGGTKTVTSVWVLSDDGEVRMQHKLSEMQETIPYCSYFDPEKVSLQPTDSPIALRFHGTEWASMLKEEVKTNWVNYYFESANDAISFQSAVYGRLLIGSFRTTKTTVIHEGLRGAFAFEEQFANIEMLRLWEDDGVSTPGAQGGVLALMHISSNFGHGWARWWINNSAQHVKVKPDGPRHAKVKGIDVTVARPARVPSNPNTGAPGEGPPRVESARGLTLRTVHGVRIEFKTEEECAEFCADAARAQKRTVPLPALA